MKVKVFEINKSGLSPLSQEMEETIQNCWMKVVELKLSGRANLSIYAKTPSL